MARETHWKLPEVLAGMPTVWAALLDRHTTDADGRCRGCRSQVGPSERWPCTLYRAAARPPHRERVIAGPPPVLTPEG